MTYEIKSWRYKSANLQAMGQNVFANTSWYTKQALGYVVLRGDLLYGYKGDVPAVIDDLPEEIKYIGGGAFAGTDLESIVLRDGMVIFDAAFSNCKNLKTVRLPSDLKVLPEAAFNNCTSLTELVIPKTVTTIGLSALRVSANTKMYYCGTLEDWDKIAVSDSYLKSYIMFYSETQPTDTNNKYWHYDADGNKAIWQKKEENTTE